MNDRVISLLARLIQAERQEILSNSMRLNGLLADQAPECLAERRLLINALNLNIPAEILACLRRHPDVDQVTFENLVRRMEIEWNVEPSKARWAVQAWIEALTADPIQGADVPSASQAASSPKYESEVRAHAEQFVQYLQKFGIAASIVANSFRDYTCKLEIIREGKHYGKLALYYKPSRASYTLSTHELADKSIATELTALHEQMTRQIAAQAADKAEESAYKVLNRVRFLEQVALEFVQYLRSQGCEAVYQRIYQNQFARIAVLDGYFDLYNTHKVRLKPYLHSFKNAESEAFVTRAWAVFRKRFEENTDV